MYGAFIQAVQTWDYGRDDEHFRNYLLKMAAERDDRLNPEERRAKEDALCELELGPNWWLRAHP